MQHPVWPDDLLAEFERDSSAAGYVSKRKDTQNSRWHYLKKCLALGRQNKELISLPSSK